jgi:hypothetical protein
MNFNDSSVRFVFFTIIFLGTGLVFYAVFYGVGLTNDSRNYLFAAQTFKEQGELLMLGNRPFTEWVPLFPVVLSLFSKSALVLSSYIQPLIFGLTLWIWTKIISKLITNKTLQVICLTSIAFATPLILIHSFLWSEGLFLLLLSLQILVLYQYLKIQKISILVWLIIIGFFYCLQRNTGVFFTLGIALVILLFSKRKISVSICLSIVYGLISSLGFLAWNVRSYFVAQENFESGGNLFIRGFWENALLYFETLTTWFLPSQIPFWLRFVILLLTFFVLILKLNDRRDTTHPIANMKTMNFSIKEYYFLSILLISGIYLMIMLLLRPSMVVDSERFLALIYPCVFVLLFSLIDFLFQRNKQNGFKKIVVVCLIIWLIYPFSRSLKNTHNWHTKQVETKK